MEYSGDHACYECRSKFKWIVFDADGRVYTVTGQRGDFSVIAPGEYEIL